MVLKGKLLLIAGFVTVFSVISAAEEIQLAKQATQEGKYEINSTFSATSSPSGTTISLQPQFGYFFWDQIQIGFAGTINNSDFKTTGVVGVSATNYILTEKQTGVFASQSVLTTYGNTTNNQIGLTSFGVAYFLSPNVAYKTTATLSYPLTGVVTFNSDISGGLAFYF